jgi:hypothetical protein
MKNKIIIAVLSIVLNIFFANNTQAQLLKKLAEKAKKAVEKKVDEKKDDKIKESEEGLAKDAEQKMIYKAMEDAKKEAAKSQNTSKEKNNDSKTNKKPPTEKEIDEMMKGMSEEDKKMAKEMLNKQMNNPNAVEQVEMADLFTNNTKLIPTISSKTNNAFAKLSNADVTAKLNNLFAKLSEKGDASQIAMAKKAMGIAKSTTSLLDASNLAMLQGQMQCALLLSIKAALTESTNHVAQNNVAALLTQLGYPEQAIPFLNKLNFETPSNSTILNNLAYAWLGLGDAQKAYQFAFASVKANPQHPQSRFCAAVVLEQQGKMQEAKQQIEIAKKYNNTKFSRQIASNRGIDDDDIPNYKWEELKNKITVYEYLPKGWRQTYIPKSNTVFFDKTYRAELKADENMRKRFEDEIQKVVDAQTNILEKEAANPEAIIKKMAGGNTNQDLQALSKNIERALKSAYFEYGVNMRSKFKDLEKKLSEMNQAKIEGIKSCQIKDAAHRGKNHSDNCNDEHAKQLCNENGKIRDEERNRRMQIFNPQVWALQNEIEEEARWFTNAIITWSMIGNSPLTEAINKAGAYSTIMAFINTDFFFNTDFSHLYMHWPEHYCEKQKQVDEPVPNCASPKLPNLDCPVVFTVPSGFGKVAVGNGQFQGSDNAYGITPNKKSSPFAMSTSFAVDNKRISEAGLYKDAYINNGLDAESVLGTDDDEVVPLAKSNKAKVDAVNDKALPNPKDVFSNFVAEKEAEATPSPYTKEVELLMARDIARALINEATNMNCSNEYAKKTPAEKLKQLKDKLAQLDKQKQRAVEAAMLTQEIYDEINKLRGEEREAAIKRQEELEKQLGSENRLDKDELNRQYEMQVEQRRQQQIEKIKQDLEYINSLPPAIRERVLANREKGLVDSRKGPTTKAELEALNKKYGLQPTPVVSSEGLTPSFSNGFNIPGKIGGFVTSLFN